MMIPNEHEKKHLLVDDWLGDNAIQKKRGHYITVLKQDKGMAYWILNIAQLEYHAAE